jgi:hypothetical protein
MPSWSNLPAMRTLQIGCKDVRLENNRINQPAFTASVADLPCLNKSCHSTKIKPIEQESPLLATVIRWFMNALHPEPTADATDAVRAGLNSPEEGRLWPVCSSYSTCNEVDCAQARTGTYTLTYALRGRQPNIYSLLFLRVCLYSSFYPSLPSSTS